MILSDVTIREELAAGRIVIEPLGESAIQPSSVDLHVDSLFRVFRNHTTPYIDPKESQEDLTELVEVPDGQSFILHPGEFVLGSTSERVALPDDVVARLEGKSSLGRLGLLIHSSLPASEPVLVLVDGVLAPKPIGDLVRKQTRGHVVAFDRETFAISYHEITGWYEGPEDRIYEVHLASGRRVRVTAGHNLFSLDRRGELVKLRTAELRPGARVAIPGWIPEPPVTASTPLPCIDVLTLAPEASHATLTCHGPTVATAHERDAQQVARALRGSGRTHVEHYRRCRRLPVTVAAQLPGVLDALGPEDRVGVHGGRNSMPAVIDVDTEFAWLLGLFVAEGYRRRGQVVISNTDQGVLDRAERVCVRLGMPVYRAAISITIMSSIAALVWEWLGTGGKAATKRVPPLVFGWPVPLVEAFLDGLVDGDGSRDDDRVSVWTSSPGLVSDLLQLAPRLGLRAGSCWRERDGRALHQVYFPTREHRLLTSVPLPDQLLVGLRHESGLDQATASHLAGYSHATDLNNIERRRGRVAVRRSTLRRLHAVYASRTAGPEAGRLARLVEGDLLWDEVVEVRDTGVGEAIFDLEVRPGGARIENFVAGSGGVLVSNTAGFVDAGWDGHLTLELSNVANLPIAIYPGMKIGQISFLQMTTPAATPYGSDTTGSKYQGQRGPTPSRYYRNFPEDGRER